jgi:arylformamidase
VCSSDLLADAEINIAGIDYLSIERPANGRYPVHELLLGANVLIAENLNLAGVQPGRYTLVMAPLLLEDADGAPARAFLLP